MNSKYKSLDDKKIKDLDLISVFGKGKLEKIQKLISDLTGIAFVAIDYKGKPLTKMTNFTQHCQYVRKDGICRRICELSDASGAIRAAVTKKTSIYLCPFNMLEVAIPIIINDKYLGALIGGQIDCPNPPDDILKTQDKWITGNIDLGNYSKKENLDAGRKLYYDEFLKAVSLVEFIIEEVISKEVLAYKLNNSYKDDIDKLKDSLERLEEKNQILSEKIEVFRNDFNKLIINDLLESLSNISLIEDAKVTKNHIDNLSFLLIKILDKEYEPIKNIKDIIRSYLNIKKIQYGQRLEFNIKIENANKNSLIDYRTLLIYIMIKVHLSLRYTDKDYKIDIKFQEKKGRLFVIIEDFGIELSEKSLSKLKSNYQASENLDDLISYLRYINKKNHIKNKKNADGKNKVVIDYSL